jgi:hypothetical protein
MQIIALGVNKVQKKYNFFGSVAVVLLILSLSFVSKRSLFNTSIAQSPSFGLQELINDNRNGVQTYGNNDSQLKSSYTDILAVNYISDGQTLNTTFWLNSGFNSSAFDTIDNQQSRNLSYGIHINADSNPKTEWTMTFM